MDIHLDDAYEVAQEQMRAGRYVVQFPVRAHDGDEWWDCVATYALEHGAVSRAVMASRDPMLQARFLILATASARRHTLRMAEHEGQLLQL